MNSTAVLPDRAHQLLLERFGFEEFRPGQAAIIATVLQGRNVLAVMPTGSGKSLCYQLPALLNHGCTVVVSPLIALMKDQVDSLQARGIAATAINSTLSVAEQQHRLHACQEGACDLLFVAPERFRNTRFLQAMADIRVSLFAVDEAHCISEWGHDFRPDYLRLREAIERLGRPQVLALTATATVDVQRDIIQQLGCRDMQRFVSGFDRPNLTYRVMPVHASQAKLEALRDLLSSQGEGSAIVYAATRRAVEEIATFLHAHGHDVLIYHAGLPDRVRHRMQDTFMQQPQVVIIATNAFGMGVDKPDVRCVVHFNLPRSMEAYYQEAGRAGRDGLPADCMLLFSYGDVRIQEFLLEQSYPPRDMIREVYGRLVACSRQHPEVPLPHLLPHNRVDSTEMQLDASVKLLEKAGYVERLSGYDGTDDTPTGEMQTRVRLTMAPVLPPDLQLDYTALQRRKQHELQKLRRMIGYANARQCRRRRILGYFGESWHKSNCGACDYCLRDGAFEATSSSPARPLSEDEWLVVQKILSCVARMQGRYGRAKVIQVLTGSRAREIRGTHLTRLSTYGILQGTPRPVIDAYLDALLAADCLQVIGDEFPKLDLTALGQAVMRRQQSVELALPALLPRRAAIPSITPERVAPPSADPSFDPILLERLRAQRTLLAKQQELPAYCVFSDRTLRDLASSRPRDRTALLQIHGIGEVKAHKYGEAFLDLIRQHCESASQPDGNGL